MAQDSAAHVPPDILTNTDRAHAKFILIQSEDLLVGKQGQRKIVNRTPIATDLNRRRKQRPHRHMRNHFIPRKDNIIEQNISIVMRDLPGLKVRL